MALAMVAVMNFLLPVVISLAGGLVLFLVMRWLPGADESTKVTVTKEPTAEGAAGPEIKVPEDPEKDSRVMYVWAAQGPFLTGYASSMAMAGAILAVRGEDALDMMRPWVVAHEQDYNAEARQWEERRKGIVRDSISHFGKTLNPMVSKAESVAASEFSAESDVIRQVETQLENAVSVALDLGQPGSGDSEPDEVILASPPKKPEEGTDDIIDVIHQKISGALSLLTHLVIIVIFFATWSVLIAGNFILGLAFGWIPALIIAFMAGMFSPALKLLIGVTLLLLIGLIGMFLHSHVTG